MRAVKSLQASAARQLNRAMPVAFDVTGAILLSVGANMIYAPAGWITAGIAAIVLNWRIYGD